MSSSVHDHSAAAKQVKGAGDTLNAHNLEATRAPVYPGSGTPDDPYIVDWVLEDAENPYNWSKIRKWVMTVQLALGTWTVSFSSSSYSGGLIYTMREFNISDVVAILGVSLYVLGFGLGPLVFAPMSEMFGRRIVFLATYSICTLLHLGGALCNNVATLLSCRLLSGIFGSSPLTNAGGTISDIWNARDRGMASAIYSTAPYLGPVIGPVVGGFVAENPRLGWHFNFWLMFIFSAGSLLFGYIVTPETYAPVLLRRRAERLCKEAGGAVHYVSKYDILRTTSWKDIMRVNMSRPFRFLFTEPIVAALAFYMSTAYATLYAFFSAFPIVFQQHRHFTASHGGLAFIGVGLGIVIGMLSTPIQNRIYWRAMDNSASGKAPPEARLHIAMLGGILLPISLFWFAWTTQPNIHFIIPILSGIPFGTGIAVILVGLVAYLMDTYSIYFASAVAATVVSRSVFAAAFPLFSPAMFDKLGDQWACSVFAFLALVCMPMPVLFWKYGRWVRGKSVWAWKDDTDASGKDA